MSESTPNFCSVCGSRVKSPNSKYCSTCGSPLNKPSQKEVQNEAGETNLSSTSQTTPIPESTPDHGSVGTSVQPASSYPTPYASGTPYQSAPQRSIITPNDIMTVSGNWFSRKEMISIASLSLVAFFSHVLRYLMIFNTFPSLREILIPIPMYFFSIILIFLVQRYLMRVKGVQPEINANRFDYTLSLVFSTFFLSLISFRYTVNKEQTTVPETLSVPEASQYGMSYMEVSREQFIGKTVRPRMYMLSSFFVLILGLLAIYYYFNSSDPELFRSWQLLAIYLGGFVVVEIVPIFGRHNEEASDYGRFKTLGIFLGGLLVWVIALLGEGFFTVLIDRVPI